MKTAAFIAFLVLVWGWCWPVYKTALAYTPPILFAGMRTLLGGLLLAMIMVHKRRLIRFRETWPVYLISGLFNNVLFFGLQTVGLMYMPGGLFSVIVYLQPVLVSLFAWIWLGESMTIKKFLGLIMGVLGVAVVSLGDGKGKISAMGIVLALMTAVSWAIGVVYVKKEGHKVDSIWLVALQCLFGGMVMTGGGLVFERCSDIVWNPPYLFGLLFGSLFGVSAAWIVYFKLVQAGEASKIASFTFLVPIVAVLVGSLFFNEPFTMHLLIGMILVTISILLVNRVPGQSDHSAEGRLGSSDMTPRL
jgi:drug/metabolite transporter (DMT)-like permease